MNIGVVSYWFNRGQATVGRRIVRALESDGHHAFVLARPPIADSTSTRVLKEADSGTRGNVTYASSFSIPEDEYINWVREHALDAVFFFQNYEFSKVERIRRLGVKTIGTFMWEDFHEGHVAATRKAYDTVYTLFQAHEDAMSRLGVKTERVRWSCDATDVGVGKESSQGKSAQVFGYLAGYSSQRKVTSLVIKAFNEARGAEQSLRVKSQIPFNPFLLAYREQGRAHTLRNPVSVIKVAREVLRGGSSIRWLNEDLDVDAYNEFLGQLDVVIAVSRWEGLNLNMYEALSMGIPQIQSRVSPMTEVIEHGYNGLLVDGQIVGYRGCAPIFEPDAESISRAIIESSDPRIWKDLREGSLISARKLSSDITDDDLRRLL